MEEQVYKEWLLSKYETVLVIQLTKQEKRLVWEFGRISVRSNLRKNVTINKVMVDERKVVAPKVYFKLITEIMEIMSSLKFLSSCFSADKGTPENGKLRVGDWLETFGTKKTLCDIQTVSSDVQIGSSERLLVPALTYRAETWVCRMRKNKISMILESFVYCEHAG